jgi:hypothetical protein
MDFHSPSSIEEVIITSLAQKSTSSGKLLLEARKVKPLFTKQALYAILRRLIKEEVIVKHGKHFSLSSVWIGKMTNFFASANEQYGIHQESVDFLSLADGDKISYNFKSPEETDRFWGHAFDVLADLMPPHHDKKEPIYIYNPHEWFMLIRQESELHLFRKLAADKRQLWLLAGHRHTLDLHVKQFFDGTYLQYHTLSEPLFDKPHYYINVFGDFIIEAFLDVTVAEKIDQLYISASEWNEELKKELSTITTKGKTRIVISHNTRKAKRIKKMIGKYFN